MTAQFRDILIYRGESHFMSAAPLSSYLKEKNISVTSNCSACWRGYFSTWEMIERKLYLIKLTPCFTDDEGSKLLDMQNLFPGQEKVFASWFSGEILIQEGELIKYFHMGYSSKYETHMYLIFENGIIEDVRIEDNRGKVFTEKDHPFYNLFHRNE